MAQFRKAVLTDKGTVLLQKIQTQENKLKFTKVKIGSGEYTEEEPLNEATALKQEIQEFLISSVSIVDPQTVRIISVLTNQDLDTACYIREIGVYADDPDEGEILYSIAVAYPGRADYMPAYDGFAPVTIRLDVYQTVSNSENVTMQSGTGAYAAAADLERLEEIVCGYINDGPIIVSEENIPVAQRKAGCWYFFVTTSQNIQNGESSDDIIAGPNNMALKIVEGE